MINGCPWRVSFFLAFAGAAAIEAFPVIATFF